ncbi:hypothetical protein [Crenothrix polyspora]|jgi:hypothetical protein|uniref:Uncharacterized protein n=1 Tax=Crenothrix polyspora TaxID=360316 RepID=A0A1R4HFX4_9GAMM|nr:hypothetical protein [Crenothrix polyspora]SJM95117.1 conserved exported hypothetical protein [Crenothrix polyspora]
MKTKNTVCLIMLMAIGSSGLAYAGSKSNGTNCTKPTFSTFTPAANSVVEANSSFSFRASSPTITDSIVVTIKGEPVPVTITPKNQAGNEVTGVIPESAKGDYARITINALGPNGCKGSGGWLLSVAP